MGTPPAVEAVRYYGDRPGRSSRGSLVIGDMLLAYQGHEEIVVALAEICRVDLTTARDLKRSGLTLDDLDYRPPDMLFLRLDCGPPAGGNQDGAGERRTLVFGSCYYTAKQANEQMENLWLTLTQTKRPGAELPARVPAGSLVTTSGLALPAPRGGLRRWLYGVLRHRAAPLAMEPDAQR